MDLVTGATGIVGTPLVVKLLSKGQTVRALYRPSSDRARVEQAVRESDPEGLSGLEWVEGDVCDQASLEAALEGVTRVYHCAALVSF
ncbi:MAG: NAD-dependent epimerase/dehydratase family protein, partial [Bacteroidota bacterium]|nr:NAD-dependent epimerase/dehydratase family protein [Bacteroidota bacterium]